MPIVVESVRVPAPEGAVGGIVQPDGTVVWYMPEDGPPPSPPAPDMTQSIEPTP